MRALKIKITPKREFNPDDGITYKGLDVLKVPFGCYLEVCSESVANIGDIVIRINGTNDKNSPFKTVLKSDGSLRGDYDDFWGNDLNEYYFRLLPLNDPRLEKIKL